MKRYGITFALGAAVALIVAACGGTATVTPPPVATSSPARSPTPIPTATQLSATPAPTLAIPASGPSPTAAPTSTGVAAPTTRPVATPTAAPPTPTPAGPQPKYGGTLQARFFSYPAVWDTYNACCGFTHAIFQNVLNHLIRYQWNSISEIEGDLAQSWDVSADGKTYTFKLRPGVQWQDGKPLTSADILFNFQRALDPKYTFNRSRVTPIASMEAPDPLTFRTSLRKASASYVANIASAFMVMYPAHVPDPAVWQASPVGTGGHKVKGTTRDVSISLTRNETYFRKDAAGRQLPYLDGIVYTAIADPALALAAFRSGRVHCGCSFDRDFMNNAEEQLKKEIPGVKLGRHGGTQLFLQFNAQRAPFDNVAFRQAVAIGLDKEQVATAVWGDKVVYPAPPFLAAAEFSGRWGLPKEELTKIAGFNPDHQKDLAAARQKLAQPGISPGGLTVVLITGSYGSKDVDAIASSLATDLGLRAQVNVVSATVELTRRQTEGAFQLSLESRSSTIDDPAEWFAGFISSAGAFNYGKYSNPRIDELLLSQDAELDPAKRRALIWELQRITLAEFPIVPLSQPVGVRGARPEVFGYTPGPSNHSNMRIDEVWLER